MTVILPCKCANTFQDIAYGDGNRVHNLVVKPNYARCAVCGRENEIRRGDDQAKKPAKDKPAKTDKADARPKAKKGKKR